jgi:anti-anti-sigma factor
LQVYFIIDDGESFMRVEILSRGPVFKAKLLDKLTFADHIAFRKLIDEVKSAGSRQLTLDMAELAMIDSSGLGMIMIALDEAKKSGFVLTVENAAGPVMQLLKLSKMDVLLKVA